MTAPVMDKGNSAETARELPASRSVEPPLGTATLRTDFINGMALAANGVQVVTTDGPAGRIGLTVNSMVSVTADPPTVSVSINRKSPADYIIRANGGFCVNLLSAEQIEIAKSFAGRPGPGGPYNFGLGEWVDGDKGGPHLVGAVSSFGCALEEELEIGTHTIFAGRVVSAKTSHCTAPLLYTQRRYAVAAVLEKPETDMESWPKLGERSVGK